MKALFLINLNMKALLLINLNQNLNSEIRNLNWWYSLLFLINYYNYLLYTSDKYYI